jgi:peptidoglycan/xylan/chitin deacetylase (PgdA/CDA1 family)
VVSARARVLGVPILMYHEVSPAPDSRFHKYTVTPAALEAQLDVLVEDGFRSITAAELAAARDRAGQLPPRPVLITFDDGFKDAVRYAAPLLAARGLRAMFYLVTGLSGASSRWMVPEVGLELPLIDWNEARALEKQGFVCGSHTASHPRLTGVADADCRRELSESRRRLEDALGREVRDLAYPFGHHDDRVVEMAREAGYRTAVTTEGGFSRKEPLLRLRRLAVKGNDTLRDFRIRVHTSRSPAEWWDEIRIRTGRPRRA